MTFDNIYLLHGKGGSPEGSAKQLEEVLRREIGVGVSSTLFHRPRLLHSNPDITTEASLADFQAKDVPVNSVLIGISLGGLVAAKLQEESRENLHVICINSPTWADGVRLEKKMPNRLAFYSSRDEVIAGRTSDWPTLAQAFDLPWLTHDTDAHKLALARLAVTYLQGGDVAAAVRDSERNQGVGH